MRDETFIKTLGRAIEKARLGWEIEEAMARKAKAKWSPETIRALAFRLACSTAPGSITMASELVEALDAAADEIDRLKDSSKWAHIRAMQRRRKGG